MVWPVQMPLQLMRALRVERCKTPVVDPKSPVFVPNLMKKSDLVGHNPFVALR